MLGIIVTPSKIAWQVEQEAYDLERYMTEDRSDEDKLEFILDVLRPIDVTKWDCDPHDTEEQSYRDRAVEETFVGIALFLYLYQSFQFLHIMIMM